MHVYGSGTSGAFPMLGREAGARGRLPGPEEGHAQHEHGPAPGVADGHEVGPAVLRALAQLPVHVVVRLHGQGHVLRRRLNG